MMEGEKEVKNKDDKPGYGVTVYEERVYTNRQETIFGVVFNLVVKDKCSGHQTYHHARVFDVAFIIQNTAIHIQQ